MRSVSKISSRTFYVRRHACHRRVYFLRLIFLYYCPLPSIFVDMYTQVSVLSEFRWTLFYGFSGFGNLISSDPRIHISSTYLAFNYHFQYFYSWGLINWNMNWIYYCHFFFSSNSNNFQLVVIFHNYYTFSKQIFLSNYLSLNYLNSSNQFVRQIKILIFDQPFFLLSSIMLGG